MMIQTATFLLVIGALTATAQDGSGIVAVCLEPQQVGPCRALVERYFYNSATQQCELFYWGGCQPNGNNFQTLSQCQLNCTSGLGDCIYNKKWYANGANIPTSNPCEFCSCIDGQVNCAILKCARPACSNPTWITGKCCPVCPETDISLQQPPAEKAKRAVSVQELPADLAVRSKRKAPIQGNCLYENTWYPNGATWQPSPCEYCSCTNGQVNCAIQDCAPPPCSNPTTTPGQCCPVCLFTDLPAELARSKRAATVPGTCYHNNKRYPNGATWKPSACEHCSCRDGQVNCAIQDCAAPQCANPTTTPGHCCPVCKYPDLPTPEQRCPKPFPPPPGEPPCEVFNRRCTDTGPDRCPRGKACCYTHCGTQCL